MDEQQFERVLRRAELIRKYMGFALSDDEKLELHAWINENEDNRALFNELTRPAILRESLRRFYTINTTEAYEELQQKIFVAPVKQISRTARIMHYMRQSAAAMFFTSLFVIVIIQIGRTRVKDPFTVLANFALTSNKTYLALSNGYPYALDELPIGASIVDGPVKVVKIARRQIAYEQVQQPGNYSKQTYHAVATPRSESQAVNFTNGSNMLLRPATVMQYPIVESESKTLSVAGEARFTAAPGDCPLIITPERNLQDSVFTVMGDAHLRITINSRTNVMTISTDPGYRVVGTVDPDTGHIRFEAVKDEEPPGRKK